MELNLISSSNLPEGTIFSVRAGNVRRQAPTTSCKPFRFPEHPSESPLKIELFQPVGVAYVVLRPGETQYKVNFPNGGAVAELHVRHVEGGEKAAEPQQDDLAKDNSETAKEAKEYLETHRVMQFVQALLQTLIKEKPANPFSYMSRHFTNGYEPNEKRAPVPANLLEEEKKEQNPSAAPTQPKAKAAFPTQESQEVQSIRQKARETLTQGKDNGTLNAALKDKGKKLEGRTVPVTPAAEAHTEKLRQKAEDTLVSASESGKLATILQNSTVGKAASTKAVPASSAPPSKAAAAPPEAKAPAKAAAKASPEAKAPSKAAAKAVAKASPEAAKLKKEAQQTLLTAKNNGSLDIALANKGAAKKDIVQK